jgi:hypothetical protein
MTETLICQVPVRPAPELAMLDVYRQAVQVVDMPVVASIAPLDSRANLDVTLSGTLNSTLYTLHSKVYSLSQLYTLHSRQLGRHALGHFPSPQPHTPNTQHPTLYTLHPTPYTLNPEP